MNQGLTRPRGLAKSLKSLNNLIIFFCILSRIEHYWSFIGENKMNLWFITIYMMKKQRNKKSNPNPMAKSLRGFRPKVVRSKKAYSRKGQNIGTKGYDVSNY